MTEPATADKPYYGFETEVYTLIIEPDHQRLNVSADVLNRIPYFAESLKDGNIKQDTPYVVGKCSTPALAAVLAFVRDGRLPDLCRGSAGPLSAFGKLSQHVLAYQYARLYGLEAAQNAIVDSICPVLAQALPDDVDFVLKTIAKSLVSDGPMYELLSRRVAYDMQILLCGQPFHESLEHMVEQFGEWDKESVIAVMAHLLEGVDESPAEAAMRDPCQFHEHYRTEYCIEAESEELEDDTTLPEEDTDPAVVAETEDCEEKDEDRAVSKDTEVVRDETPVQPSSPDVEADDLTSQSAGAMPPDQDMQDEPQDPLHTDDTSQDDYESNSDSDTIHLSEPANTNSFNELDTDVGEEHLSNDDSWSLPSAPTPSEIDSEASYDRFSFTSEDLHELSKCRGQKKRSSNFLKKKSLNRYLREQDELSSV